MTAISPADQLDFFGESFGRAICNKRFTPPERMSALTGLAENLVNLDGKITGVALRASFERRIEGALNLLPTTTEYEGVRKILGKVGGGAAPAVTA